MSDVETRINELKYILNDLVAKDDADLTSDKILELSREIDILINIILH